MHNSYIFHEFLQQFSYLLLLLLCSLVIFFYIPCQAQFCVNVSKEYEHLYIYVRARVCQIDKRYLSSFSFDL